MLLKARARIAMTVLAVAAAPLARSGIKGSAHDFAGASWNTSGEVCLPCHTPHRARSRLAPIWNHEETGAAFTLYSSDTLNATVGEPTGVSKACLSCHDGTVAVNAFGGNPGEDTIGSGRRNLGANLSNDHPVCFLYNSALAFEDVGLYDPNLRSVPALGGATIREGMLINDELHCTSCHDPHKAKGDSPTAPGMLLVNNSGSALCLTCHNK